MENQKVLPGSIQSQQYKIENKRFSYYAFRPSQSCSGCSLTPMEASVAVMS